MPQPRSRACTAAQPTPGSVRRGDRRHTQLDTEDDPLEMSLLLAAHAPLLTPAQEISLARRVEQGDRSARETLVNSNIRLVASVARRYMGRGVPLEDMIQEGVIGLLRAIDKYNYLRGYRFSTYATHWIRQAISRAVANQGRTIRLPAHVVDAIGRLARTQERLRQKLGRSPTRAELAREMGLSEARIAAMLEWARVPLSIDCPMGEDSDTRMADFMPAPASESPADRAFRAVVRDEILGALAALSPKEQEVIALRFGLHDGEPRTLQETGCRLNMTRERARQIEGQALAKLRRCRAAERAADALA